MFNTNAYKGVLNKIEEIKAAKLALNSLNTEGNAGSLILGYNDTSKGVNAYAESVGGLNNSMKMYLSTCQKGEATLEGYQQYLQSTATQFTTVSIKSKVATLGVQAFNMALNMITGMLVAAAITAIIKGLDTLIVTSKEIIEAGEKAATNIDKITSDFESLNKEVKNTTKTIDDLSDGVNRLTNENKGLSDEEYQQYIDACNQLAEVMPEVSSGIDANGNALIEIGDKYGTATEAAQEYLNTQKEIANYEVSKQLPDLYAGVQEQVKQYRNNIDNAKQELAALHIDNNVAFSDIQVDNFGEKYLDVSNTESMLKVLTKYSKEMNSQFLDIDTQRISFNKDATDAEIKTYIQYINNAIQEENHNNNYDALKINQDIDINQAKIDEAFHSMDSSIAAYIKSSPIYDSLSSQLQSGLLSQISDFDYDAISQNYSTIDEFLDDVMASVENGGIKLRTQMSQFLSLDPNTTTLTVSQYVDLCDQIVAAIAQELGKSEIDVAKMLGLDIGINDAEDKLNKLKDRFTSNKKNDASGNYVGQNNAKTKWLDTLNPSDLEIVWTGKFDGTESLGELKKFLADAKKTADNNVIEIKTKTDMISSINGMSDAFDMLDKIYADVRDGDNTFDFTNLDKDKFTKNFEGLEKEYTKFIDTVAESPNDISKCQDAFNDLSTAYIRQSKILDNVTEDTASVTENMLKIHGLANAHEMVQEALQKTAEKQEILKQTGIDLSTATTEQVAAYIENKEAIAKVNAQQEIAEQTGKRIIDVTGEEITAFMNENYAVDETTSRLAQLSLAQYDISNNALNTADDCDQLYALAAAAGVAKQYLDLISDIGSIQKEIDNTVGGTVERQGMMVEKAVKEAELNSGLKDFQDGINKVIEGIYSAPKTGVGKGGSSSGSKKDTWLEEYKKKLGILEDQLSQELITEREFYDKSEDLLNKYLKDTPEHIAKYEEEITEAGKKLHDAWSKAFEQEKSKISDKKSDGEITQHEYLQQLDDLNNEYYARHPNKEVVEDEFKKLAEWGLDAYKDALQDKYVDSGDSYVQTVFGNIDMDRRSIITWSDELKKTYQKELASWKYNPDVDDVDTVFGSSDRFGENIDGKGYEIAFSPILQTDEGGILLSQESVRAYVDSVLAKANEDGKITDAEILSIDAEGTGYKDGDNYVKGLIAAIDASIGDNNKAIEIGKLMHFSGDYGSLGLADDSGRYGKYDKEHLEESREVVNGYKTLYEEVFDDINSHMDNLQSSFSSIKNAIKEYNKNKSLSIDTVQELLKLDPKYMSMLMDENGQLQLNADTYKELAKAKMEEMKIDYVYEMAEKIKGLKTQAQAYDELMNKERELHGLTMADAIEELNAQVAIADAKGGYIQQAAHMYQDSAENAIKLIDMTDFSENSLLAEAFEKTYDWVETLLKKISDSTDKLVDKVDKFFSWQKKNAAINKAVKASDKEISANKKAYKVYKSKANEIASNAEIPSEYINKIKNGSYEIEDLEDKDLSEAIDEYTEYWDKMQACLDTIEELYDKQRDLIKQKLDNIINYYSDLDSYLASITSKVESLINLNEAMGKRSSLTDLVEQFAAIGEQIDTATNNKITIETSLEDGTFDDLRSSVKQIMQEEQDQKVSDIKAQIADLAVTESGTYDKLLTNIAKTQAKIAQYEAKGWDVKKAKSYEKLQLQLQNYYDLQKALDENATSNTIASYQKIYTAWQKLQNKLDSGKTLSKSEQKKYDAYQQQLKDLSDLKDTMLSDLDEALGEADGTIKKTEVEVIQEKIDDVNNSVKGTATYQGLVRTIEETETKLAKLDEKGYDNLSKSQKKTYDKLKQTLEGYYDRKEALEQNATADNIIQYNKTYIAWKKLQDKIDAGKTLSYSENLKYTNYGKQLEAYIDSKKKILDDLNEQMDDVVNPKSQEELIKRQYGETTAELYKNYQKQINDINSDLTNSQQYKTLKSNIDKLQYKKDTKGLSKTEETTLAKYTEELEALQKGGTSGNIASYMSTWEAWYKLDQKIAKGSKLSSSEQKKYDEYTSKLKAWNNEKQGQIDDLTSQLEDDLAELEKTYQEKMGDASSQLDDYYGKLYDLAKQIAEYNITTLETQLSYLSSMVAYYEKLIGLYKSFDGEKLSGLLTGLQLDTEIATQEDAYKNYLETLKSQYEATVKQITEYKQLLDALDTNDFEGSMDLFKDVIEKYKSSDDAKDQAFAKKIQDVMDLLDKRAEEGDNWEEYADEWENAWEKALGEARNSLIDIAGSIQEVNDALRELEFSKITDSIEDLNKAKETMSSLAGLIKEDWLYDNDGLTEYGQAKAALLVSQLEDAQTQASKYLQLYNEIQKKEDTYATKDKYQEALHQALQDYYSSLSDASQLQDQLVSMAQQAENAELNALEKVISKRKEALQAKKDYYDYDKTLKDKTKDINSLKAQIEALEGLEQSAEIKSKLAQLNSDLEDAQDDYDETVKEHTYTLQTDALDKLISDLKDAMDKSADTVEETIETYIDTLKKMMDAGNITNEALQETLQKVIDLVGSSDVSKIIDVVTGENNLVDEVGNSIKTEPTTVEVTGENTINSNIVNAINEQTDKLVKASKYVGLDESTLSMFPDSLQKMYLAQNETKDMLSTLANSANYLPDAINSMKNIDSNLASVISDGKVNVSVKYDSLLHVDGNVDKAFLGDLSRILEESYEYTTHRIYEDVNKLGVTRTY